MKLVVYTMAALCVAITAVRAQVIVPAESQRATVSQRIGVTDLSITYSRPMVKGRTIWGDLVPYGQVWRAGANENTVFSVSHPVLIDGKALPAGTYGLHMIPTAGTWTIIFNKQSQAWGSYFYQQSEDALRVDVKPGTGEQREALTYEIPDVTASTCTVSMRWAKADVRFTVTADVNDAVVQNMKNQLTSLYGFDGDRYAAAAAYMQAHGLDAKQGKAWAATAVRMKPSYQNLMLAADYEEASADGNAAKVKELREQALAKATNQEVNAYGYQLMGEKKYDKAVTVLEGNAKRFPDDPNVWDSLGEAYAMAGNTAKARESFRKVLGMKPEANVRQNSESWLRKLEGK